MFSKLQSRQSISRVGADISTHLGYSVGEYPRKVGLVRFGGAMVCRKAEELSFPKCYRRQILFMIMEDNSLAGSFKDCWNYIYPTFTILHPLVGIQVQMLDANICIKQMVMYYEH